MGQFADARGGVELRIGRGAPAGVYYIRLRYGNRVETQRAVLLP